MLAGATFQALTVYTMVGVIYFVLCSVLAYLFRRPKTADRAGLLERGRRQPRYLEGLTPWTD